MFNIRIKQVKYIIAILLVLLTAQTLCAQPKLFKDGKPNKELKSGELKKYFKKKYKGVNRVSFSFHQYDENILNLRIEGSFMPEDSEAPIQETKKKTINGKYDVKHARSVARKFLKRELNLMGAESLDEMVETYSSSDPGSSAVLYKVFLNGAAVEKSRIVVSSKAIGEIYRVTANLVPITQAMRAASANTSEMLSEEEIRALIKSDQHGSSLHFLRLEKVIQTEAPYVVWIGNVGDWLYEVDAFTGGILRKKDNIINM